MNLQKELIPFLKQALKEIILTSTLVIYYFISYSFYPRSIPFEKQIWFLTISVFYPLCVAITSHFSRKDNVFAHILFKSGSIQVLKGCLEFPFSKIIFRSLLRHMNLRRWTKIIPGTSHTLLPPLHFAESENLGFRIFKMIIIFLLDMH